MDNSMFIIIYILMILFVVVSCMSCRDGEEFIGKAIIGGFAIFILGKILVDANILNFQVLSSYIFN